MSTPQNPYPNRGPQEFTSAPAPTTAAVPSGKWGPPMPWIQIRAAGSGAMTVMHEDGSTAALTALLAGDILRGPFLQVVSTTVSKFWVGDGEPPATTEPAAGLNGASVPAGSGLTTGNVLQVNGAASTTYAPVNLAGGGNFVTGQNPMANSAAQQTTAFTAAFETLYSLALTSAAVINLPALPADGSNHRVHFFNPTGSAPVVTPNVGNPDFIMNSGGTTGATAAGPTAGKMQSWVGVSALNRWVLWG